MSRFPLLCWVHYSGFKGEEGKMGRTLNFGVITGLGDGFKRNERLQVYKLWSVTVY